MIKDLKLGKSLFKTYYSIDLTMEVINRYIRDGKRLPFRRFKNLHAFWQYIMYWYTTKIKFWESFRIIIQNTLSGRRIDINPSYRFTEDYKNKILYKFYHTLDMKLYYWVTLTTQAYEGQDWLEYTRGMKINLDKMWKRFYDYQKKYDKGFKFIRVYELTKKNTLHVHVAIYSKLSDKILRKNFIKQVEKFGWVKIFKYTDHQKQGFVSKKGTFYDAWVSNTWESWYNEGYVKWKRKPKNMSSNKLINYLMKYMTKNASLLHRALFTFFRIRTYSISRNMKLPGFTRGSSEEWIFEQKYVDKSQIFNTDSE